MAKAVRDPETDLVIVALPNDLHKKAVLLAAEAGKPVLCTKPLGRTAAEALEILEAVEARRGLRRISRGPASTRRRP